MISQKKRPVRVWLYRLADGTLVGFAALAETAWRWQGEDDPRIPVSIVIWYAVHSDFHGKPDGPREDHFSFRIFEDLVAEADRKRETHPILGLFVSTKNQRAIEVYDEFGFTTEGFDIGPESEDSHQKMYVILNPEGFARMYEEATRKRKRP